MHSQGASLAVDFFFFPPLVWEVLFLLESSTEVKKRGRFTSKGKHCLKDEVYLALNGNLKSNFIKVFIHYWNFNLRTLLTQMFCPFLVDFPQNTPFY